MKRIERAKPAPSRGIVHLGLGAFFRSHGARVIEDSVLSAGGDWGITGVSLRSADIRDRLKPQDCVYTAVEMDPGGQKIHRVEILTDVLYAPENPARVIAEMSDPATRIVSLTVTEKGYCHVPSTGHLDAEHPDILHDIDAPWPRSAIGYLVRALQKRYEAGDRPFTVLSCDNLPDNGNVARTVVTELADRIDPGLGAWISAQVRFPSTMVDRIVPATTAENIARLDQQTGVSDAAPVFHEPFLQWVIEDDFTDDACPAFEAVTGVQLVGDVAPYELMKIRMLNGTHSALAYLGYLAGHETISETVADPVFRQFVQILWSKEIIPSFHPPENADPVRYADALLARYDNPAIRHRTWQIAMDGSQKLPQRILGTLADNHAAGRRSDGLCLAVAAWMRYVGGQDERGRPIDVRDPLAGRLRGLSDSASAPEGKAAALLSVSEVFGPSPDPEIAAAITRAYCTLVASGAAASVQACCDRS